MFLELENASSPELSAMLLEILEEKRSLLSVEEVAVLEEIIERLKSSPTEKSSFADGLRLVEIILRLLQFFGIDGVDGLVG